MSVDAKFIRDIDPYFQYPTDENPTTQQEYQEAVRNWVSTEEAIVDSHLWQPTTNYNVGNQIKTPSLPPQCVLVCTAAGTSGNEEPDYTNVDVGDSVTDGTVTWLVSEAITSAGGTMTGGIKFDATGEIGYRGTTHTSPYNPCKQLIVSATDIDHWADAGGAKISLHTYDSTGTNTSEDGSFSLLATDGINGNELKGKPDGTLNWSGYSIRLNGYNSNTAFFQLTNLFNVQKSNVDVGWSYADGAGAGLGLRSASDGLGNNAGEFFLFAKKGNTGSVLSGKPDGTLAWGGNAVATVTASNITSNRGYIRFSNGLQICWGEATIASAGATVTLPAAFADSDYRIVEGRWWITGWNENYYFSDRTTTTFKRTGTGTMASNARVSMFIAIGKWK